MRIELRRQTVQYDYPPEFNEKFKRYIRERDGNQCALCPNREKLQVHHINYLLGPTTGRNCISLCKDCHARVHRAWSDERTRFRIRLTNLAVHRERQAKGDRHNG